MLIYTQVKFTLGNYKFTRGNSTKGQITRGNCMDNITQGKYTLVTLTLGNLALSLGNHTPGTQILRQK